MTGDTQKNTHHVRNVAECETTLRCRCSSGFSRSAPHCCRTCRQCGSRVMFNCEDFDFFRSPHLSYLWWNRKCLCARTSEAMLSCTHVRTHAYTDATRIGCGCSGGLDGADAYYMRMDGVGALRHWKYSVMRLVRIQLDGFGVTM